MRKEIMLNKSLIGDFGLENEENIPHEIINLFRSDNGRIYVYVPPYGGYATKTHGRINYLLLTGGWNNRTTEVYYLVGGLTPMHEGGLRAEESERENQRRQIRIEGITYGGKYLDEIKMAEEEEKKVFFMSFCAETIMRPRKRMYFRWDTQADIHENDYDEFCLSPEYNYQRQRGYLIEGTEDYQKVIDVIENSSFWEEEIIYGISQRQYQQRNSASFLSLVRKEYDETAYTNMLYEFFKSYPEMFVLFAKEVLEIMEEDAYSIFKEVKTNDNLGRLDLLATGEKHVIVIENKLKSGLNGVDKSNELSQLSKYYYYVEDKYPSCLHHYYLFEPNYNDINIAYFDKDKGKEYKKIKYSQLYEFFNDHISDLKNGIYSQFAEEFINNLYIHSLSLRETIASRFLRVITER